MTSSQALEAENLFRLQQSENEGKPFNLLQERENSRDAHELTGVPSGVDFESCELAGVGAIRAIPKQDCGRFNVVFLHGGAFCLMSAWSHHRVAGHIAKACGVQVIVPDYSLAPEHPFPQALDECVAVVAAAQEEHPLGLTALMGDSAGGGLTLSALQRLRDEDVLLPFAAVLMAPWLDLTLSSPSVKTAADEDVVLTEPKLRIMAEYYAGAVDSSDPRISPLFGTFDALPPLYLQAAGKDLLRDDSLRLKETYATLGLDLKCELFGDMIHCFHFFAGNMPEADQAIAKSAEFLKCLVNKIQKV